nr:hypothetical protein [uncultured archaeon]
MSPLNVVEDNEKEVTFPDIVPPVNPKYELEPYSNIFEPSYPNNFLSGKLENISPIVVPVGILPGIALFLGAIPVIVLV